VLLVVRGIYQKTTTQDANRIFVISQEPRQLATSSILQVLNNFTRYILSLGWYALGQNASPARGQSGFAAVRGVPHDSEKFAIE
jgi:hypothetical protein